MQSMAFRNRREGETATQQTVKAKVATDRYADGDSIAKRVFEARGLRQRAFIEPPESRFACHRIRSTYFIGT